MSQSKYWMLTGNLAAHATEEWWRDRFAEGKIEYLVGQPEIAPATGHVHGQFFAVMTGRVRPGQVREVFPHCHVERMAGTVDQCIAYCSKEESWAGTWRLELGDRPVSAQGKRSDLETIRDLVKQGMAWVDIIDFVPQAMRYSKEIKAYRLALEEKKDVAPEQLELRPWQQELFELLLGPVLTRRIFWISSVHSGVGKTTTLRVFGDMYPGTVLMGCRKMADLMHAYDVLTHRVIWFDLARSDPLDAEMTSILETLSNGGYVFSGKYESCQKRVRAHIVVTTNRSAPHDRLPQRITEYRLNEYGSRVVEQRDVNDLMGHPVPAGNWMNPDFILE